MQYQHVDNVAQTIECFKAAIIAQPNLHQALNNLGVIYATQGLYGASQRLLRAAIAANAEYAEAYNNLGVLLRDTGCITQVWI